MFQIRLNALFQSIETLFNTLPDPDSVFVMELPGLGKCSQTYIYLHIFEIIHSTPFLFWKLLQ